MPSELRSGPIARADALRAGVPARVLEGVQFVRVHGGVYRHRDHAMTFADRIAAARMVLPDDARTTGVTRLQEQGLDHGSSTPLHFVVQGDLHLRVDGVFLHRTAKMPPCDGGGVSNEAAYVAFCAGARVIDAIKVGSYLLFRGQLDLGALAEILNEESWRRGAAETEWVLPHLDGRCRSMPEAELLACVRFSGLPAPEVNAVLTREGVTVIPDLWWPRFERAVEYEGGQHQSDRGQYTADIDRYAVVRRSGADCLQVTRELMRMPRVTMGRVHRLLVAGGCTGSPPEFGELWQMLFVPLSSLVRRRRPGGA